MGYVSVYYRVLEIELRYSPIFGPFEVVIKNSHTRVKSIPIGERSRNEVKECLEREYSNMLWRKGLLCGYIIKVENELGEGGRYFRKMKEV